jgi:hypothetical protein
LRPFSRIGKQTGALIYYIAAAPALFGFSEAAVGNLREKNDHWNTAVGAFFGGLIPGIAHKRLSVIVGIGAFMSATFGTLAYTGGRLSGWQRDAEDMYETKQRMREVRRYDIGETITTIGEGRGIRPTGYDERRRARIKEAYGIEIKPVKATID